MANGCAAQDGGQLLMFEGRTCSLFRSFTTRFYQDFIAPPQNRRTVITQRFLDGIHPSIAVRYVQKEFPCVTYVGNRVVGIATLALPPTIGLCILCCACRGKVSDQVVSILCFAP